MKRKRFGILCAAAAVMLTGTMSVSAETESGSGSELLYEDLNYEITEDGSITITNCMQSAVTCTIPESIDGKTVTQIADSAFAECYFLEEVVIPDTVTGIGRQAFSACSALESVTMPSKITQLGAGVFDGCSELKTVVIPQGIEELPQAAFYECTALEQVTLPEGICTIGSEAFYGCASLQTVVLPESTDAIADYAFQGCTALEEITFPAGVQNLGGYIFQDCNALTAIHVDEANPMFCDRNGVLFTKDGVTLVRYPQHAPAQSYRIPDGCTQLANGSFVDAANLRQIDLNQATVYGQDVFFRCTGLENVVLPEGTAELFGSAFAYCSALKSITLPDSLKTIGDYCFYACAGLEELTVPDGVEKIGAYSFFNCVSMKKLFLPDSITEIGDGAMGYYAESEDTEPQKLEDFSVVYNSNRMIYDYVQQYDLNGTGSTEFRWWIGLCVCGAVLVVAGTVVLIVLLRRKAAIPRPVPGGRQGSAAKRPEPNQKGKSKT